MEASVAPRGPCMSVALQGGGALGAFTMGVIDGLLSSGVRIGAASGASSGALNAVLLADGLARGGADEARKRMAAFWNHMSRLSLAGRMMGSGMRTAMQMMGMAEYSPSPYSSNPFRINPLRDAVGDHVDFSRLSRSGIPLFISATRVLDGQPRIFTGAEVTLDAIMASTCLPRLQSAVEIGGDAYWDGGYTSNPPLMPLVHSGIGRDILLVQLTADRVPVVPMTSEAIKNHLADMPFHEGLLREVSMFRSMRALAIDGHLVAGEMSARLSQARLSRIMLSDHTQKLVSDPTDASSAAIMTLSTAGRLLGTRFAQDRFASPEFMDAPVLQ